MKSLKAYLIGWSEVFRSWKLCLLLYVLNFLVAFISLIPLSSFLSQTVGQSLSLNRSLDKFDYAFLSDFFNAYGEGVLIILDQSIVLLILYFLVSIFLMGGIIYVIKNATESFRFSSFWKGCAAYFGRMFRLTIYFLLFHGALLSIFFMLFVANGISPFELESEAEMIHCLRLYAPIYVLFAVLLFMIQDYAKIHMVYSDKKIITVPILESFSLVFRNIPNFLLLYLLNIGTFLLLVYIYYTLNHVFQPNDMTTITIVFLLGQAFVLGRIVVKILNLASANHLYKSAVDSKPVAEKSETIFP